MLGSGSWPPTCCRRILRVPERVRRDRGPRARRHRLRSFPSSFRTGQSSPPARRCRYYCGLEGAVGAAGAQRTPRRCCRTGWLPATSSRTVTSSPSLRTTEELPAVEAGRKRASSRQAAAAGPGTQSRWAARAERGAVPAQRSTSPLRRSSRTCSRTVTATHSRCRRKQEQRRVLAGGAPGLAPRWASRRGPGSRTAWPRTRSRCRGCGPGHESPRSCVN